MIIFNKKNNEDIKNFCKKYKVEIDKRISFVCYYWRTPRAWGHNAEAVSDSGYTYATARCRYYNRTWERYQFQSVLIDLLKNYATALYDINYSKVYILDRKQKNDFKKLKKADFLKKYKWMSAKEYVETKKHYERISK